MKQVKISSIAMPMPCPLGMQKTFSKNLLDRFIDLANFAYQCSLVPSPNFKAKKPKKHRDTFSLNAGDTGVAVNRSNFSGREDRGRTFWSNWRDRMECGRILSYLLYGSVASLPSPSSNIEAWPYGTSLRSCIQGTRGMWTVNGHLA